MKTTLSPIIEVSELVEIKASDDLIVVNASSGPNALSSYQSKHLDGALFLELNQDLSEIDENVAKGGRHPLPDINRFAATLSKIGISEDKYVVIYDDKGGANSAARLWWMLKAIGHEKVQVLNGGIQAAEKQGYPLNSKKVHPKSVELYRVDSWKLPIADLSEVESAAQDTESLVIDVRAAPRYKGEFEPIDLVAGHIPGAVNVPFEENLDAKGLFKAPDELRQKYLQLFGEKTKEHTIFHCGSGVTACHSLLAVAYAGLEIPKLYVGSWSEWSRNNKSIATE